MEGKHDQITLEQSELVFKFIERLFNGDVQEYWDLISKIDQARVFGMFTSMKQLEPENDISFYDYVDIYFRDRQKQIYEKVRENPGLATHQRITDYGELLLYVLDDVKVPRVYIAETEVKVFPIVLTVDAELEDGQLNAVWKVRLYNDKLYKDLESEAP